MNYDRYIIYVLIMALVTFMIRMLPFVLWNKKIKNVFVKSFLYYAPYAVLSAMTLPSILSSTGNIITAVLGLGTALLLSYFEKPLIVVAISSCGVVLATQIILDLIVG